jgi:ElaB/YqjD/DUF883 family membrane-anchored ribosome-binding protein
MDHTQREIRNEIESTRKGMVDKIALLEERVDHTVQGVKRSFDAKYQTRQHPWLALGLSVAAGYLLSGLILGPQTAKAKLVLPADWNERVPFHRQRNAGMVQNLIGMVGGAVTATAVSLARDFASRTLSKYSSWNRHRAGHAPNGNSSGEQRIIT